MSQRPDPDARPPRIPLGWRIVSLFVIAAVRLMRWRVDTRDLEHVPDLGGAVITWNHHSHVDFLVTSWDILFGKRRHVRYVALRELWRSKLFGWVPRLADAVPVDRWSDGDRDRALKDAAAAARDGDLVMIAPEGTISTSFELLPWRTGAARIAQMSGRPLVPSASWGSHRLVTTGHRFDPRRAHRIPVVVAFGEPIHVGPDDDVVEATERARAATQALVHRLQETYPDGAPAGAWWVPRRLGGAAPDHATVLEAHAARRLAARRVREEQRRAG